jgi:hypothetical protein
MSIVHKKILPDPERFRTVGDWDVKMYELTRESLETEHHRNGYQTPLSLLEPARYAQLIRSINKSNARILVCAVAQEDTRRLYNLQMGMNAEILGVAGAGVEGASQHVLKKFPFLTSAFCWR